MPNTSPGYNSKMVVVTVVVIIIIVSDYERNPGGYGHYHTNLGWT